MAAAKVQANQITLVDLRAGSKDGSSSQIIYVPTPDFVVEKMLEMAKVTKDDVVYDLGCGDGRLVVMAAKKLGARGVGVDLDRERVKEALANVEKAKVEQLVEIRQGDALKVPDLEKATVVLLYMLPEFMEKLKPVVLAQCKPGTRIVAHDYPFPGWEPQRRVTLPNKTRIMAHTLYLWVVGEK
jgi:tRNA A58 N-methylase Trm61